MARAAKPEFSATQKSGTGQAGASARAQGLSLIKQGKLKDAIAHFETAITFNPADTTSLFHLARTADQLNLGTTAITFYERALAVEPDMVEALVNLSNAYRAGGRGGDAVSLLKTALERRPEQAELWLCLGNAMRETGDRANARLFFEEALRLKPGYPRAHGNLGDLAQEDGRHQDALEHYSQALKKAPKDAGIRFARSLSLIEAGDLKQGWADYEARFKKDARPIHFDHGLKPWKGEPLQGRKLLICAEQGVGDQIMFAGLLPELARRAQDEGGSIVMDCEERLLPLFARSFPTIEFHATKAEDVAGKRRFSYPWLKESGSAWRACPLGSLPSIFRNTIHQEPSCDGYLSPDTTEQARWRAWLSSLPAGPKVGLCWRSGLTSGTRQNAYADPALWADLMNTEGATFVCVQYDATTREQEALERHSGVTLHMPPDLDQKRDIDRSCALLSELDLVVSAPTAVAYQAAAVGTATLRLVPTPSWTRAGGLFDSFAPLCEDAVSDAPGDWTKPFDHARSSIEAMRIGF